MGEVYGRPLGAEVGLWKLDLGASTRGADVRASELVGPVL